MRGSPVLLAKVLLTLMLFGAGAASAQDRIALVIGNSDYQFAEKVPNAARDATRIAEALERMKFTVTLHLNLDFPKMQETLYSFGRSQSTTKVALFYYAGHAYQVDGRNLLLPVDSQVTEGEGGAVRPLAIEANAVVGYFQGLADINVMFLDACRDNVFKNMNQRSKGLARFDAPAPSGYSRRIQARSSGSFVAFSTEPEATATDGAPGGHSPFAAAMLAHMEKPGLSLNDLMDKVKADVATATDGKQRPWTHSSLTQAFYFVPPREPPRTEPHEVRSCPDMLLMAKRELDPFDALGELILKCAGSPEGQEATRIRQQLVDSRNCERALNVRTIYALQNYLTMHAQGICRARVVEELRKIGLDQNEPKAGPPERPKIEKQPQVAMDVPPKTATRSYPKPEAPPAKLKVAAPPQQREFGVLHFLKGSELNIRKSPGSEAEILGKLQLGARSIFLTGAEETVDGKRWVEITTGGITGWVNSTYIGPTQNNELFRWTMEPHWGYQLQGQRSKTLTVSNFAECVATCVAEASCKAVEYEKSQCVQFGGAATPVRKQGTASALKRPAM